MAIRILTKPMAMPEVRKLANEWYGILIKGCVDIVKNKIALGGDYHLESCEKLIASGSSHRDVWGFNIRFDASEKGELEFDSLVNIKPALKNKSREVEDLDVVRRATTIINEWIAFE